MSLPSDVIERLPGVEGLLNYLAPMAEKPMNLTYDPPPGVPRSTGIAEPHVMRIHDARPIASHLTLDGEGVAIVEHRSAVKDFYDEDELRRVYYPEAERLVAEATGTSRVLVFDHTIRRRVAGGIDRSPGTPRQPVTSVHNDYTVKSGPQRVRDLMGEEAEELLRAIASRSSICGGRSVGRCAMHHSPSATRRASLLRTLCPLIWSTAIGSGKPIASGTTPLTAGSTCLRCGPTKRS